MTNAVLRPDAADQQWCATHSHRASAAHSASASGSERESSSDSGSGPDQEGPDSGRQEAASESLIRGLIRQSRLPGSVGTACQG